MVMRKNLGEREEETENKWKFGGGGGNIGLHMTTVSRDSGWRHLSTEEGKGSTAVGTHRMAVDVIYGDVEESR
jgi:hypothetical protein